MGPITEVRKKVLVVCKGNLYRSPVAAAIMARALNKYKLGERIEIYSAGLDVGITRGVPQDTISLLRDKFSIDLSRHQSKPVTPDIFHKADLVLAMEQQQVMRLAQQYPRQTRKLRQLSELCGQIYDIQDPLAFPDIDILTLTNHLHILITQGLNTLLTLLHIGEIEVR